MIRTIVLAVHKERFSIIITVRFPAPFHPFHDVERHCCACNSVQNGFSLAPSLAIAFSFSGTTCSQRWPERRKNESTWKIQELTVP